MRFVRCLSSRIAMVVFCICISVAAFGEAEERPNVILIYIDDLGYGDLGCYGCRDIPTPHIDRLAKEGVRCTASHITNPPCCPSRCALIMGQYGQRFGKYGMSRGLPIPEDRPTLAKLMLDHGYVTGQIGKWDIGSRQQVPLNSGFSEVRRKPPMKKYSAKEIERLKPSLKKLLQQKKGKSKYFCFNEAGDTVWLTDYDGDSVVDFVERHQDEPFFLYWSPEAVHSFNDEAPARLTRRTTARSNRRKLAGSIVSVDDQVGKLLNTLEQTNLREKTLIIFSSDNGASGGEGGSSAPYAGGKGSGTQKEGWVRVPTIFSMPGRLPQGGQYDGLIANFDFYATIAVLAGADIPDHCDGVDLFPFFRGEQTGAAHDYLFWLNNEPGDAVRRHLIAVRWKHWRLYRKYEKDEWQLFDLKSDPQEEHNVSQQNRQVVEQLAKQHAEWAKTLAPLAEIPQQELPRINLPAGHGWERAAPRNVPDLN